MQLLAQLITGLAQPTMGIAVGCTERIVRLGGLALGLGAGAVLATSGVAAADATDPVVPVDGGASAVLNGDTIELNPYPSEIINTITNPLDTQVISVQGFVLDAPGVTGPYEGEYFQGTVNDTTFSFGPTDQYIDVTFSDANLPPGPGSIINVLNYGGGFENAYASIEGSAPADELITPFGNFAVPTGLVEFLGPNFFVPSVETTSSSAAGAAAAETTPAALLSEATTNFTDANQFLGEIPSGEFASVSGAAFNQGVDVQDITSLGISENALVSYDNGVLADFLNPLFTSFNQGWDQASEAALTADQALETAVAGGSAAEITSALTGLIEPSYQAFGPDFASNLIDLGAHFLTGVDPFTVGLDSASAMDPGIIADVLSSIGF
jgi:hypothetical protein